MNGRTWMVELVLLSLVVGLGSGCVGLDEHRQLEMTNRTALAEKAQCESELYDARAVADTLRSKLATRESELDTKNQLIANLQSENDQLEGAFGTAQETLKRLAEKTMPTDPVVIQQTRLPAALDSALKAFASQFPTEVDYNETTGVVKWKSDVLFALGSDVVKETATTSLSKFGEILKSPAAADFEVVVVGHTDDRPIARESTRKAHPTNWHLSGHRAISVAKLILNAGYDAARVGVMGYGEYRPAAPNDSEENRALNRRVEVYLVERGSFLAGSQAQVYLAPQHGLAFAKGHTP